MEANGISDSMLAALPRVLYLPECVLKLLQWANAPLHHKNKNKSTVYPLITPTQSTIINYNSRLC